MRRKTDDGCRGALASTTRALLLLVVGSAAALAPQATGEERPANYLALKAGIYSPSESFTLANIDVETTFDGDTETGFDGEIAFGHYVLPTLALELGVGYFKGKGSLETADVTVAAPKVDFDVIPFIFSAKALSPAGSVDPYGEAGIGAYFTQFNVSDNLNTFDGTTTFGLHVGAGLNVNITQSVFIGVEGRYVWASPSFGDQKIKLNDTEYSLDGFELNGFTTTLVLGFGF
jgi:opacity protein-like surface antigen